MRLVYCEWPIVERWAVCRVATLVNRKLSDRRRAEIESTHNYLDALCMSGLQLACTVASAAHLITGLYKQGLGTLLAGESTGFPFRKSFARKAAQILLREVELLSPSSQHFRRAEELWYAYCEHGVPKAYAQFADYVDAAMVLDTDSIVHVVVHHQHIPYILNEAQSKVVIHFF